MDEKVRFFFFFFPHVFWVMVWGRGGFGNYQVKKGKKKKRKRRKERVQEEKKKETNGLIFPNWVVRNGNRDRKTRKRIRSIIICRGYILSFPGR